MPICLSAVDLKINKYPDIMPKYGTVGFISAEIIALEEAFANIDICLCYFYREQSWTRKNKCIC